MKGSPILFRTQYQTFKNASGRLDFAGSVRVAIFILVVWIFLVISYSFYSLVFRFMELNKPLGPVLNASNPNASTSCSVRRLSGGRDSVS